MDSPTGPISPFSQNLRRQLIFTTICCRDLTRSFLYHLVSPFCSQQNEVRTVSVFLFWKLCFYIHRKVNGTLFSTTKLWVSQFMDSIIKGSSSVPSDLVDVEYCVPISLGNLLVPMVFYNCKCVEMQVYFFQLLLILHTDMAEPIQQLTTNNNGAHTRERVPFTLINRKEKVSAPAAHIHAFSHIYNKMTSVHVHMKWGRTWNHTSTYQTIRAYF